MPSLKRLVGAARHGEWLRHRPVGLTPAEQHPVRAIARSATGERDVSALLFPVSLKPFVIGLARVRDALPGGATELRMFDETGARLGAIRLEPTGVVEHPAGSLDLYRPADCSVSCVPLPSLAWRYAAAWQHNRVNARRPGAFQMDFADIRALNVFYMMPRPVYLVSVMHGDRGNLFPMDLVGPLGDDRFLLALRASSQSVETICRSGRIVLGGAPARFKDVAYRLGRQHRERSIDWRALDLETALSPLFGWPVAADSLGVRELELIHHQAVGSHMLFVARVARQSPPDDEPQLCHVSDMYAHWREMRGRPLFEA